MIIGIPIYNQKTIDNLTLVFVCGTYVDDTYDFILTRYFPGINLILTFFVDECNAVKRVENILVTNNVLTEIEYM